MIRLRKGLSTYFWEELVRTAQSKAHPKLPQQYPTLTDTSASSTPQLLAVIGEKFDVGNEVCGAVLSIRYTEDVISVWNRNADNTDALNKIK